MHAAKVLLVVCLLVGLCCATVGPSRNPKPVSPSSVQNVVNVFNNLLARWEVLDAACDPNAVFAVTYLHMVNGGRKLIQQGYFDDGDSMAVFTINFAQRYIDAYDAYKAGNMAAVSSPWKTAFDFAASGYSNVSQNLFLGMNAHINYDLGIATWQSGFTSLSKKPDFDRVNDLMHAIQTNISTDVALRYDASNMPGNPITDIINYVVLEITLAWRQNAWVQSQGYIFPYTRGAAMATNAAYAGVVALPFSIPSPVSTVADRVAYCEANHAPNRVQ